jgi:putative transposase
VKYAFIEGERIRHPVPVLCRVLSVSRGGYYRWRTRGPTERDARREDTLAAVRHVFEKSRRTYGSPRVERELRTMGHQHSRRYISALMRRAGLRARGATRRRPRTQPAKHTQIGNVLNRRFTTESPNRVWASDFTYIPTYEGWLFLAVVLDLASRRIVGWSMRPSPDGKLTLDALQMAVDSRQPPQGLLHHSDRGIQYSSSSYLTQLARYGMTPSFSRIGDCWDNAVVESFFHTIKVERVNASSIYRTRAEAKKDLFEYIEVWYNQKRRHSTLGYVSPAEYEARL